LVVSVAADTAGGDGVESDVGASVATIVTQSTNGWNSIFQIASPGGTPTFTVKRTVAGVPSGFPNFCMLSVAELTGVNTTPVIGQSGNTTLGFQSSPYNFANVTVPTNGFTLANIALTVHTAVTLTNLLDPPDARVVGPSTSDMIASHTTSTGALALTISGASTNIGTAWATWGP
jgi:hypothetical protein